MTECFVADTLKANVMLIFVQLKKKELQKWKWGFNIASEIISYLSFFVCWIGQNINAP